MDANKTNPGGINPTLRRGFTLVELLTVIIIIGILAGLITAAAVPAIRRVRESTIRQEITQLEMALEQYKQERGDYPPDFAGVTGGATGDAGLATNAQNAILLHFRKAFPRYTPGVSPDFTGARGSYACLLDDINYATRTQNASGKVDGASTGLNTDNVTNPITPAAALVLMLGGPPAQADSSSKLLGFSANPANPFARGGSRLPSLFEFDETRIDVKYSEEQGSTKPTSWPVLIPPHIQQAANGEKAPYVYFRPRNRVYWLIRSPNNNPVQELPFFCPSQEQGICTPYADTGNLDNDDNVIAVNRWMEPTKFQIICAGLDGLFNGPAPNFPVEGDDVLLNAVRFLSGEAANIAPILPEEDDNITNFTEGKLADRAEE